MKIVLDIGIIPSKNASTMQITKMANAFSYLNNDVTLIGNKHRTTLFNKCDITNYYNINNNINIKLIIWIPRIPFYNEIYSIYKSKEIIKLSPDIVITRNIRILKILIKNNINVIFEYHHPFKDKSEYSILEECINNNNFKGIIVITKSLKNHFIKILPNLINKIYVLPDGAEINNENETETETISLTNNNNRNINIGYIGSLYPGKGIELIYKLSKIAKNYNFHVIGGNSKDIRKWEKVSSNIKNLYFHGFVNQINLNKYKNAIDIFLLPNQEKIIIGDNINIGEFTSPLKMFEYMAMGKPIVASNLKVLKEILIDRYNSLLVEANDENEWLNSIEELVTDKTLANFISNNAKNDIITKYSYDKRAENIIEICLKN